MTGNEYRRLGMSTDVQVHVHVYEKLQETFA